MPEKLLASRCPSCEQRRSVQSQRKRQLQTRPGPIRLKRWWHHCWKCGHGWSPPDQALGLAPYQQTSTGLTRWQAAIGRGLSGHGHPKAAVNRGMERGVLPACSASGEPHASASALRHQPQAGARLGVHFCLGFASLKDVVRSEVHRPSGRAASIGSHDWVAIADGLAARMGARLGPPAQRAAPDSFAC